LKLKVFLEEGATKPSRAHNSDAGLDLYSRESKTIYAGQSETFDTGVHIELPKDTVGFIKSKSGLNVKYGITSEGVIDELYTGSIVVKLYNHSDKTVYIEKGQKISQLVILPILKPEYEEVDSVDKLYGGKTERADKGFGSSGKF
jgi:dUTP pyrophosphatase